MEHNVRNVRIFGDSVMKGILYDAERDRYVGMENPPMEEISKTYGLEIKNSSIFGCTVTKGQQLLGRAIAKGLGCDTALVEYGGNDCDFDWSSIASDPGGVHDPKTPPRQFETTLKTMISTLRKQQVTPLLMTLPPIDAKRYFEYFCRKGLDKDAILGWLHGDIQTIERFQELYSLKIGEVARQTGTTLIDIRSAFLGRWDCSSLICADGIHPNRTGHLLIASMFSDYIDNHGLAVS
jgi:lysophospholipase L1-like esterase